MADTEITHRPGATAYGHQHAEAFMLMRYRCPGGHLEIIWNSADQVTPFVISCRCGAQASHVDWHHDAYAPDLVPPVGSRVFVLPNAEAELARAQEHVDRYWDGAPGVGPMREHPVLGPLGRDGAAQRLAEESLAQPTPALVEVTEPLRARFEQRRVGAEVRP